MRGAESRGRKWLRMPALTPPQELANRAPAVLSVKLLWPKEREQGRLSPHFARFCNHGALVAATAAAVGNS